MSPLASQLAALLQCGPAGHGFGGLVQQLQDQSPEPLVWTVKGASDRVVNRIESFSFLPNRPSLPSIPNGAFLINIPRELVGAVRQIDVRSV